MLLHPDEIKKSISTYGWNYQDGKLTKSFEFDTYMDGIKFVTKIAPLAEKLNHHPDLQVGYIFNLISMGSLLSFLTFAVGLIMYLKLR